MENIHLVVVRSLVAVVWLRVQLMSSIAVQLSSWAAYRAHGRCMRSITSTYRPSSHGSRHDSRVRSTRERVLRYPSGETRSVASKIQHVLPCTTSAGSWWGSWCRDMGTRHRNLRHSCTSAGLLMSCCVTAQLVFVGIYVTPFRRRWMTMRMIALFKPGT